MEEFARVRGDLEWLYRDEGFKGGIDRAGGSC